VLLSLECPPKREAEKLAEKQQKRSQSVRDFTVVGAS